MSAPREGPRADRMPHAEAWELLPAAALGALDAAEGERVMAHAAGCARCVAELAALRESAAALAHAAPRPDAADDAARRSTVRERLMARAAAESGARRALSTETREAASREAAGRGPDYVPALAVSDGGAAGTPATPAMPPRPMARPAGRPALRWPLFAALAASLLVAATLGVRWQRALGERDVLRTQLATAGDARRDADALRAKLDERDRTVAALTGRDVTVVEMVSQGPSSPWARMFWDRKANQWLMFAGNLPHPGAGRTYELWLVADGKKIPAGTFEPDARGEAVVRAEYALGAGALQAVAVTAEPAGGVEVATGPVVIAGAVVASR